jgi:hypothetical protein
MDELIAKIRQMYPGGLYGPPCTEADIAEAEETLKMQLPTDLRTMYRSFNGLWVSGAPSRLFALLPRHASTSLVKSTLFWRAGPGAVDSIIFYGMSRKQYYFGVRLTEPQVVVEYNYDLDEPQVVGQTILEAYIKDEEWVKSLGLGSVSNPHK